MFTASIVVHRSPAGQLTSILDCLLRSAVKTVYVIDNSPESDLEHVCQNRDRVKYLHVENNGFGAGHNIAIREAINSGMTYHLSVNADVEWQGDILATIVDFMDRNPDVGLLSPKVYYPDGALQYSCRKLPTPLDVIAKRFLPASVTRKLMDRYMLVNVNHNETINCPYLLGSFLFFRIDALKDTGLFDERFFMYPEDIDITRRIHRRWKTLYWPGVKIIHVHNAASRKSMRMLKIHIVNMIRYFNKWGWIHDHERSIFNKRLLLDCNSKPVTTPEKGRG